MVDTIQRILGLRPWNVILIVISVLLYYPASAQDEIPASRTMYNHLEKFEEYRSSDYERALYFARLVDEDVDSTTVNSSVAAVYDFLASHSEEREYRYRRALSYKQRSSNIYRELGDKRLHVKTLADIGRLYFRVGDYHHAYSYSALARDNADTLLDRLAIRETYLTMELVDYFYHKDTAEAMALNRYVSDSYADREEARQSMRALNNRFHYTLTPRQVDELLRRSEALHAEFEFEELMISIYLNVALQQILFNDMEACKSYLERVRPMIGSNFKIEGYYYSALGFYYVNMGDIQRAIEMTSRSIEILSQGDFDEKNVHSYFLLQELYRIEGRYKEAYESLMKFAETYTRQNSAESAIELSKLINDLELQHAEERYNQQRLQMEQERKYDRLLWRIHAYGLVALAVLGVLLYSRYRLQRKNHRLLKGKAEQELCHKNEIIRIQKLQQYQEQHNMSKLTEELVLAANTQDNKELRSNLKRVIQRLQRTNSSAGDWLEVEKMMADNNDAFFENLLREYPNLTKNERKLCTLIHMNLSTKEISNITHQSIGSINIARSRLRQKFGITGDDKSLITFLDRFNAPGDKSEE